MTPVSTAALLSFGRAPGWYGILTTPGRRGRGGGLRRPGEGDLISGVGMQIGEDGKRRYLAAILVLFVLLSAAYAIFTRPKYGPDERSHFVYLKSLATKGVIPPIAHASVQDENSLSSHEAHQPPLYYAYMAACYRVLKTFGVSDTALWRGLRLLNIPLGVFWILGVFALFRVMFEEKFALGATAFTALIPIAPYMSGVISNDVLIAAWFTWALVYLAKYIKQREMTLRGGLALGLLIGLANLTKAQGLLLFPLGALAMLFVYKKQRARKIKQAYAIPVLAMGIGVIVCSGWFIRNFILFHQLLPQSLQTHLIKSFWELTFSLSDTWEWVSIPTRDLFAYFWTPFWMVSPYVNLDYYHWAIALLMLLPLPGIVLRIAKKQPAGGGLLTFLMIALLLNYLSYIRYILFVDLYAKQQGRLLLATAPGISAYFVLGFDSLLGKFSGRKFIVAVGLLLMVAANVWVMTCCRSQYLQ
jgi:4-amino-4-deoxy-L-arabinose transferase-like glycosyltransferase